MGDDGLEEYEEEYSKKTTSSRKPIKPLPKSNVGLSGKNIKAEIRPLPMQQEEMEEEEEEDEEIPRYVPEPRIEPRTAKVQEVKEEIKEPEIKYVAVPRAVPMESMINEIYDGQQEIKQMLAAIMENLK